MFREVAAAELPLEFTPSALLLLQVERTSGLAITKCRVDTELTFRTDEGEPPPSLLAGSDEPRQARESGT